MCVHGTGALGVSHLGSSRKLGHPKSCLSLGEKDIICLLFKKIFWLE